MEKIATTSLPPVARRTGRIPPHPMAPRAAATQCALLITGETGTGKGHLARWIHEHSARAEGPFVPVNCGAIPESLVDSQLFGHAKGAFSGAATEHKGLVRAAAGGTLLFDEISELPLTAQTRLLRLLDEREVQPVGYSRPVTVDLRIIAATNTDLHTAVQEGRFRADLFFRLDVVRVPMRPLRARGDELVALLDTFNAEFSEIYRQPRLTFAGEAIDVLHNYAWPGNIRELRSVVERLYVLRGADAAEVTVNDLSRFGQLRPSHKMIDLWSADRIDEIRRETVNNMLTSCRGNVSRAAMKLGVHRSTVYRWLSQQPIPA